MASQQENSGHFTERGMANYRTVVLAGWLALWALAPCAAWPQDGATVKDVSVRLELVNQPGGGPVTMGQTAGMGAEAMSQLEAALTDTVKMALLTQLAGDLDYITRNQNAVVNTLGDVISSALEKRGFTLKELVLEPGATTVLTVRLKLAEQQIQDFSVSFSLLGNTPVVDSLVGTDEEALAATLYATLARTPYGDSRWLSSLISDTVEQKLASLPAYRDFEHLVSVQPGQTAKVVVTFTPRAGAAVVTGASLSMHSLSLANLTLAPARDETSHFLQAFVGAPLNFIEARLPAIEQALYQHLINHPVLARQCADAKLRLKLSGCTLRADAAVATRRVLATARTRLALWDIEDGAWEGKVTARLGYIPAGGWGGLFAVDYFPGEEQAYPMLGAAHLFDSQALLAAGWDFKAQHMRLLGQVDLGPSAYLAGDVILSGDYDKQSEISLHYRIRDIYELQLVSNLEGEVFAALAASF